MADVSLKAARSHAQASQAKDPATALQQVRALLKAKDDTSRFVGLAILKSVLDNQPQLREDVTRLTSLWDSISPTFLDRLLHAGSKESAPRDDANDMTDIAVAVLHKFSIILPAEAREDKKLVGRIGKLINALVYSSQETTVLILQTLLTLVSRQPGALEFLEVEDISPLTEIAPEQPMVSDIISMAWSIASTALAVVPKVRVTIGKTIPQLLSAFNGTDAVTFLAFIGDSLPKLPTDALPKDPKWLKSLITVLRNLVIKRPTLSGRAAYTRAAAALLQAYPTQCPPLLFTDEKSPSSDSKPFGYLLVNLLLVDIRSSFPALLSKLNDPDYPAVSARLSSAFDVISSFIGFLVRSLDDEEGSTNLASINIAPDLLLKLRKDIAETMSLTIEYLRDRWDASVAGAAGLHPSARTSTTATAGIERLSLTWESKKDNVAADNLLLASIRVLALWLREDENENLREEAAGLMDMLIELYKASTTGGLDFRYPVLTALEPILTTEDGFDGFVAQDGWKTLSDDLISIIAACATKLNPKTAVQASRGIEVVRVLLAVLDHESMTEPKEEWMALVKAAAAIKHSASNCNPFVVEVIVAVLQLAGALLNQASPGMRKRYAASTTAILGLTAQLKKDIRKLGDDAAEELCESLDDVVMVLDNLR